MSDPCPQPPAESGSHDNAAGRSDEAPPAADDPLSSRPGDAASSGGLRVDLILEVTDADPPLQGWLDVQLQRLAALDGLRDGQLTVTVVDDAAMTDLHGRYKGDATTTDVLTFDLREREGDPLEGDVIICLDEARRQARRRGHEPRLEALLYALHGLMHLRGEDDQDEAAFDRMHTREDRLLAAAGFGPVFARVETTTEA